eukprot:GHVL01012057.1.p1 GENE.GHVL01012057.1~~GHVL01012057.1.p1  ORF type:complete len:441 (+),score=140.49 GHVL01012057.1:176-1498(+)
MNIIIKRIRLLNEQKKILRKKTQNELEKVRKESRCRILQRCDIILCTLSGAATEQLEYVDIGAIIIDEAAQAIELSTIIPLRWGVGRLIMIGDPQQLPATVLSKTAASFGYQQSLFQRFQSSGYPVQQLTIQYRMHPTICQFPSNEFYDGRLITDETVMKRQPLLLTMKLPHIYGPLQFYDIESIECRKNKSIYNDIEASFIVQLISHIIQSDIQEYNNNYFRNINLSNISIITPYKEQVYIIKKYLLKYGYEYNDIQVATTDSFQGRENMIIIISCVRASSLVDKNVTNDNNVTDDMYIRRILGFICDCRRMNVGFTRARDALWVIGRKDTLILNKFWESFINYTVKCNGYLNIKDIIRLNDYRQLINKTDDNNNKYKRPFQRDKLVSDYFKLLNEATTAVKNVSLEKYKNIDIPQNDIKTKVIYKYLYIYIYIYIYIY